MKCGFSKKIITPPLGTPLVGYYSERLAKGVIDDLYVRAAAFSDEANKAVVLEADLCLINYMVCDDFRKTISDSCQIPIESIWISANHTHTGPLTGKDFASDKVADPKYIDFLRSAFLDAATEAFTDLKPAEFYAAETQVKGISFIRRFRLKDGTVRTNPGALNPEIDHPLGTPNESLKLLKILRQGGDDLFIFNFGTHSDTVGGDYISADFSGYACDTIERAIPGTQAIFLLAPQGDVNHFDVTKPNCGKVISDKQDDDVKERAAHARYMGRVLAGAILQICDRAKKINANSITWAKKELTIPSHQENHRLDEALRINDLYTSGKEDEIGAKGMHLTELIADARRIIRLKDGPEAYHYNIYALRLGDFVLAGLPGEPFTDIHNRILDATPFENTMVCCQINASTGYFPTTKAFREGGYEAKTSPYAPGVDNILVDGMIEILNTLK